MIKILCWLPIILVDIGPEAGKHGGEVVASGIPKDFLKLDTLTSSYLNGKVANRNSFRKKKRKWPFTYTLKALQEII